MTIGLGGRAVRIQLHRFEITVKGHADIALLMIGIPAQIIGSSQRLTRRSTASDHLVQCIDGLLSLTSGQHVFNFLYGFHNYAAKLQVLHELSLPLLLKKAKDSHVLTEKQVNLFVLRPTCTTFASNYLPLENEQVILSRESIMELLSSVPADELYRRADRVRQEALGDDVHLRGLIEFSNYCRNDCLYCGIRRGNRHVQRYRMSEEELVETATRAAALGFQTIVMQSGEDLQFDQLRLCRIIEKIKRLDVALTLSVGERDYEDYKAFREAGADRYLMRIETTDRDLYHRLNPGMSWEHRHECLLMIRELGYELGSGIMVGLPGQTIESIADDLLYLKGIGIDMAGIGPFIPHPETPLANEAGGTLELALRTMAVMRMLMPDINIPATTAMESLHPQGRIMALQAGANVVMPNVTEGEYRSLYELYPGKICVNDTPAHCRSCIGLKIMSIGRTIGQGRGGHKRKVKS